VSFDLSRVVDLLYAVCSPGRIERCGFSVPAGKNGLEWGKEPIWSSDVITFGSMGSLLQISHAFEL
jgi:hypothetical protein